jgi:hypothetical protein
MIKFIKCVCLTPISLVGLVVFPGIRTPFIKMLRYGKVTMV